MRKQVNPNSLANLELGKFKKGQTANPKGRPKKSIRSVVDEFKSMGYTVPSASDIIEMYKTILNCDEKRLEELSNDKSQPMLVRLVAENILSGKGFDIAERMLDRSIGKAAQSLDITSGGDKLKPEPLIVEVIDSRDKVQRNED